MVKEREIKKLRTFYNPNPEVANVNIEDMKVGAVTVLQSGVNEPKTFTEAGHHDDPPTKTKEASN